MHRTWPTDKLGPLAVAAAMLLCAAVALAYSVGSVAYSEHTRLGSVIVEALLLVLLSILFVLLVRRERRLKRGELAARLRAIARSFHHLAADHALTRTTHHYPSTMHTRPSDACHFIRTLRDGLQVLVPANLLVPGDHIFLQAGDRAPALCHMLTPRQGAPATSSFAVGTTLQRYELFAGPPPNPALLPQRALRQSQRFQVIEAPLRDNLKIIFDRFPKRARSSMSQDSMLAAVLVQRVVLVVAILAFGVNLIRYLALDEEVGTWMEMLLLLPMYTVLPMIQPSLPILWVLANHWATAVVLAAFHAGTVVHRDDGGVDEEEDNRRAGLADSASVSTLSVDSWENDDEDEEEESRWIVRTPRSTITLFFVHILRGNPKHLPRSNFLVHVLGSLSVFSSLDKQGILTLPSTNPQKVVFLSGTADDDQQGDIMAEGSKGITVLDILPCNGENGLRFASASWPQFLNQLKPIGLDLLLNNFCRGLRPEAWAVNAGLVGATAQMPQPSTNEQLLAHWRETTALRPCFCRLGCEIGFFASAVNKFAFLRAMVTTAPFHTTSFMAMADSHEIPAPSRTVLVPFIKKWQRSLQI